MTLPLIDAKETVFACPWCGKVVRNSDHLTVHATLYHPRARSKGRFGIALALARRKKPAAK
jgi:uncharacterized C2H2 Zn-finger protein